MNLHELETQTSVTFSAGLRRDIFNLNQVDQNGPRLERVSRFLDIVRQKADITDYAEVISTNNFPTGAGIASSAAAFAALSLAASQAAGLNLGEAELSALARRGSGSACRSIPPGFVEWLPGNTDASSYAVAIAPPEHWDLVDCVAVIAEQEKQIGSTEGHQIADTSIFQNARVADAPRRLADCRTAIRNKDFDLLARTIEEDSTMMHAVMMTSHPALFYWEPASLSVMRSVPQWRKANLPVCFTLDAGPNVHVLCAQAASAEVKDRLEHIPGVSRVLVATPGGGAHLLR